MRPRFALGLLLVACHATAHSALRPDWASQHPQAFAAWVLEQESLALSPEEMVQLLESAGGRDEASVRAVVLLARDPNPAITERLLQLIERRQVAPERGQEGAEITAAAALGNRPLTQAQHQRLERLALPGDPHPTLDLRVECALAVLQQGGARVAPFLIRVLRARTPAEAQDPPDWDRIDTLAWPKHRAAQGLASFLGTEDRFRPDGSWQHQMDEAQRLRDLLDQRDRESRGNPAAGSGSK